MNYYAVEPQSNRFIIEDTPDRVRTFASMQFSNRFMVLNEEEFSAIMKDQLSKGHQMTQVICKAPEPMGRPVYGSDEPIIPVIPEPKIQELQRQDLDRKMKSENFKKQLLQNLKDPPQPFQSKIFRRKV